MGGIRRGPAATARGIAGGAAALAIAVGASVLLGWALGSDTLKSVAPGLATMKANTALCFVLLGWALWLRAVGSEKRGKQGSRLLAAVATVLGGLTLAQYAASFSLGIDEWLFTDKAASGGPPGRMAQATALCMTMMGVGLLVADARGFSGWRPSNLFFLSTLLLSWLAVLGYAFNVEALYSIAAYSSMALHTALALVALSVGALFVRPEGGLPRVLLGQGPDGVISRRVLGLSFILLPALGWLVATGERASLYDVGLSTALFCTVGTIVFVGLTWNTALLLGRVEMARRKAEASRARLFEGRLLGMVLWDLQKGILDANARFLEIVGYTREDLFQGLISQDRLSPAEYAPLDQRAIGELMARGEHSLYEKELIRKDGKHVPVMLGGSLLEEQRGVSFVLDLHEKKRMEDELRRSEARFRATFELAAVGLAHVSQAGEWRMLNQRYCDILGYTQEELLGHTFIEVTYPPDLNSDLEQLHRLLAGEIPRYTIEKRYVRKDGRLIWVLLTVALVRMPSGEPDYLIAAVEDITWSKQAARNLSLLSEVSRMLVESRGTPDETLVAVGRLAVESIADACLVYGVNEDGMVRFVLALHREREREPGMEALSKYPPTAAPGHPVFEAVRTGRLQHLRQLTPEKLRHFARNEEHYQAILAAGMGSFVVMPLSMGGRVVGVLGLARADLQGFSPEELVVCEELARRIAVALENGRLFRETQEALRLRDEFLSVASHELKTPLTPLRLRMNALEREALQQPDDPFVKTVQQYLETGRKQVKRLDALMTDLLDVSRIRTGRFPIDREEVDLAVLVREVTRNFELVAARTSTPLVVESPESVMGYWDRGRLEQVVDNLLSNALKYGPGKPVRVRLEAWEGGARLVVQDDGMGMDEALQKRIFDPFVRGVSDRHYGGLGLGLHIVRTIVEALGGHIRVESSPGQGAAFTVELPSQGNSGDDSHLQRGETSRQFDTGTKQVD